MMSGIIQLCVDTGSGSKWILLRKNAKITDILNAINKECAIDTKMPTCNQSLYYQDKRLTIDDGRSLDEYGLTHLSRLQLLVPLAGGIWPLKAIKERKTDLRPLPGFITVTTSEADMISLENDATEKRAKMPCGHVIGPSSMTSYCQSLISEGRFQFICPSVDSQTGKSNCDRQWEYFLVRHVACLNTEESQEFEKKISENYLKKADGLQRCPSCSVWCYKNPGMANYVRCPMCKKNFCWACLRDWIASGTSRTCGNSDCDGRDNREKILANCSVKVINECKECPSIRACPKCLLLTEHKDRCGHMICPGCKHGFCFICLKGKTDTGQWSCSPSGNCSIAPRQVSH